MQIKYITSFLATSKIDIEKTKSHMNKIYFQMKKIKSTLKFASMMKREVPDFRNQESRVAFNKNKIGH